MDLEWKRDELARYGLSMDDAQSVVMSAIGGHTVTTTVEGRERYAVNVRYFRDYRSSLEQFRRVMIYEIWRWHFGLKRQLAVAQASPAS